MAGAGVKLFTDGSILTAAQVNTYLQDQVIMRFANAATRDAAFGGVGEPLLAEGMFCYLDDTNQLMVYSGSAWLFAASPQTTESGAYQTYTPTFNGFTLGNGTITAKYTQINKHVHVVGLVDLGTTSSMTGALDITLPVAFNTTSQPVLSPFGGQCLFYNGATLFNAYPLALNGTSFRMVGQLASGTYTINYDTTGTVPFTWNSSSDFRWNFVYEAA